MTQHYLSEFKFPKLQPAESIQNIPLTSKSLATWIEKLPVFNSKTLASNISDYLIQINSLDLHEGERFELLELLRPTVAYLTTTIIRQGRGRSVETTHQNRARQYSASTILRNMALGYQRLLVYAVQSSWLGPSKKDRALLVERILFYSAEQLRLSYMLCAFEHKDVWQAINIGYHYAVIEGLEKNKIKDPLAYQSGKGALDLVYKRAMVLAMVSPYSLRDAEIEQIHYGLTEVVAELKIGPMTGDSTKLIHMIDLKESAAPHIQTQSTVSKSHYRIDNVALCVRLEDWLRAEEKLQDTEAGALPAYLLQHLCYQLKPIKHRFLARISGGQREINAIIGLEHIYQLIAQVEAAITPNLNPVKENAQMVHFTEIDQPVRREAKRKESLKEIPKYQFHLENESEFGVQLSCRDIQATGLHVGQFILLESIATGGRLLADVRWLRLKNEQQLLLGLQLIGSAIEQVEVRKNDVSEERATVFLLKNMTQNNTLLLPKRQYKKGEHVLLMRQGVETTVVLHERGWENRILDQFSYSELVETDQTALEIQHDLQVST